MSKSTDMSNMLKQRPWLGQYPEGVPADIDETQYESLVELLEESFKKTPEAPLTVSWVKTPLLPKPIV